MPREARYHIIAPHTLYHVVAHGQQRLFKSVRDFKKFLKILQDTKSEFPFLLYSFNLIPTHYHLEIETIEISLSEIMHAINNLFSKYIRHRYHGRGHVFRERYFSNVVDKDSYFWELAAYIDLNAVRAGIVKHPKDWRWSSYHFYCKKDYNNELIDRDRFLEYISEDLEQARKSYLNFVEERLYSEKDPFFIRSIKAI